MEMLQNLSFQVKSYNGIVPSAEHVRRIPFHVRENVEKEIKCLDNLITFCTSLAV